MRRGETSTHSCVRGLYRRWVSFCKSNIDRFVQTGKHYSRGESPPSRRQNRPNYENRSARVPLLVQEGWREAPGWSLTDNRSDAFRPHFCERPPRPPLSKDASQHFL